MGAIWLGPRRHPASPANTNPPIINPKETRFAGRHIAQDSQVDTSVSATSPSTNTQKMPILTTVPIVTPGGNGVRPLLTALPVRASARLTDRQKATAWTLDPPHGVPARAIYYCMGACRPTC